MQAGVLFRVGVLAAVLAALAACGGGGGGGGGATGQLVSGGGVKGPLANADAAAHAFDPTAPGFAGAVVATATTNGAAALVGLSLPTPLDPPYILEFTSNAGTTDLTTGVAPVIGTLRTVITQEMLDAGDPIYGTLQTTIATGLAVANADSSLAPYTGDGDGTVTEAEFLAALPVAAAQVASTFGFGLNAGVDIFRTPPLLNGDTDTVAEQGAVAAYRTASEALTALVFQMAATAGVSAGAMLDELTADLADGTIDGSVGGAPSAIIDAAVLADLALDPAALTIPGTTMTVADVQQLLADETAATGAGVDTSPLTDGTITTVPSPAEPDSDRDDDGHVNTEDAFPDDPAEWADTDGDGIGDNADVCPTDASNDADGDGVCGAVDICPGGDDTVDTDADGIPDFCDACPSDAANDADGDGVCGDVDNCPVVANGGQTDGDGDGQGDACDPCPADVDNACVADADGDGVPDGEDACLGTPAGASVDADGCAASQLDSDGDGVSNADDLCPGTAAGASVNVDGCSAAQLDDDGDGVSNATDLCPGTPAGASVDADGCAATQLDDDGDGVNNADDLCPGTPTGAAVDADGCAATQLDDDGDGVSNAADLCPGTPAGSSVDAHGCAPSQIPSPPEAPSGLSAIPGDGLVRLLWTNVPGADGYTLYWSKVGTPTEVSSFNLAKTLTTYVLPDLINGTEYSFSMSAYNESGDGAPSVSVAATPDQFSSSGVATVSADFGGTTCAIRLDGSLWCWGQNSFGNFGNGTNYSTTIPVRINLESDWRDVSLGNQHTCAIKTDGSLWCWGLNDVGQLGVGDLINSDVPVQVGTEDSWKYVHSNFAHTCAIKTDGSLWCWGKNSWDFGVGVLGVGSDEAGVVVPSRVGTASNWVHVDGFVSDFATHICAINDAGELWCWGSAMASNEPVLVDDTGWVDVDVSGASIDVGTCVIKGSDGSRWCWGVDTDGRFGGGTTGTVSSLSRMSDDTGWTDIGGGVDHMCGLQPDQSLWCWGYNVDGRLGTGSNDQELYPTPIASTDAWLQVDVGGLHTCAVRADHSVWCWGRGYNGELGTGDSGIPFSSNVPVAPTNSGLIP